jgi:hypothetical protein
MLRNESNKVRLEQPLAPRPLTSMQKQKRRNTMHKQKLSEIKQQKQLLRNQEQRLRRSIERVTRLQATIRRPSSSSSPYLSVQGSRALFRTADGTPQSLLRAQYLKAIGIEATALSDHTVLQGLTLSSTASTRSDLDVLRDNFQQTLPEHDLLPRSPTFAPVRPKASARPWTTRAYQQSPHDRPLTTANSQETGPSLQAGIRALLPRAFEIIQADRQCLQLTMDLKRPLSTRSGRPVEKATKGFASRARRRATTDQSDAKPPATKRARLSMSASLTPVVPSPLVDYHHKTRLPPKKRMTFDTNSRIAFMPVRRYSGSAA